VDRTASKGRMSEVLIERHLVRRTDVKVGSHYRREHGLLLVTQRDSRAGRDVEIVTSTVDGDVR
jgi:hypothetical protein